MCFRIWITVSVFELQFPYFNYSFRIWIAVIYLTLLLPQVKQSGESTIEIPDHEAITRRQQFRLKKDRAEKKREKKIWIKQKKEKKKQEKAAKKAAKEAAKADGPKKRGRKAAEKSKEKQKTRKIQKKKEESESKNEKINDDETAATPNVGQDQMDQPVEPSPSKVHPAIGRQMMRLKKMTAAKKASASGRAKSSKVRKTGSDEQAEENKENEKPKMADETPEMREEAEVMERNDEKEKQKLEKEITDEKEKLPEPEEAKGTKKRPRQTAAKSKAKKDVPEDFARKPKAKAKSAGKAKAEGSTKNGAKEKTTRKKHDTNEEDRAEKKPRRSRSVAKAVEADPDPFCKDQVGKLLQECSATHCTHPSWKKLRGKQVDVEAYYSRKAGGIKVERSFFKNDKVHGKGKAHVAYFGCKTTCDYSNELLGHLWVPMLYNLHALLWCCFLVLTAPPWISKSTSIYPMSPWKLHVYIGHISCTKTRAYIMHLN